MSCFFFALASRGLLIDSFAGSLDFFQSLDFQGDLDFWLLVGFVCLFFIDLTLLMLFADLLLAPDLFRLLFYLDVIDPLIID